jgi:hypothetical protein
MIKKLKLELTWIGKENGGKPWKYLLIPHDTIART